MCAKLNSYICLLVVIQELDFIQSDLRYTNPPAATRGQGPHWGTVRRKQVCDLSNSNFRLWAEPAALVLTAKILNIVHVQPFRAIKTSPN